MHGHLIATVASIDCQPLPIRPCQESQVVVPQATAWKRESRDISPRMGCQPACICSLGPLDLQNVGLYGIGTQRYSDKELDETEDSRL